MIRPIPKPVVTIPHNENYLHFTSDDKVYFAATQQGKMLMIHIAAEGKNRRHLRKAVDEFIDFAFRAFPWCEAIGGAILKRSVINLASKCGFKRIGTAETESGQAAVMVRFK